MGEKINHFVDVPYPRPWDMYPTPEPSSSSPLNLRELKERRRATATQGYCYAGLSEHSVTQNLILKHHLYHEVGFPFLLRPIQIMASGLWFKLVVPPKSTKWVGL